MNKIIQIFQVLKDIVACFLGIIFLMIALSLFFEGAVIGGIAAMSFGIGITPLWRKILRAMNMHVSVKKTMIAMTCLFLVVCGSIAMLGGTSEEIASEESNSVIVESVSVENEEQSDTIAQNLLEEDAESIGEEHAEEAVEVSNGMQVHFIDVGQGDATLIISGEHAMLIDAGDDTRGTLVQYYLQKQGIEKLDYLVLTHTDADHIGGADVVINKFDINNVFIGDYPKENNVYRDLMQALNDKNLTYSTPLVGENYALGDAFFTILAPNRGYSDPNNSSIALMVQNGENRFLFTGDAEEEAEWDILANGLNMDCDVFKAGHHGSKTSNSVSFLNAATPSSVVISCEENNSYGHPHAEVLNNLRRMGIKVFRTDEQGSIIAISDGKEITWNSAPSESWKSGESTRNFTEYETDENKTDENKTDENATENKIENADATYAVNDKNGKIHLVGACSATGSGRNAMTSPVYFSTYEEAEVYSMQIAPKEDKRACGNCWK